jgi:polyferredoxin
MPNRSLNIFFRHRKRSERRGVVGAAYFLLSLVGKKTRCSPVRRAVQLTCLALFLFAFFYMSWPYSDQFSETTFSERETFKVELFLLLDPLVGLSTAIAGRMFNLPTLTWTFGILLICALIPRFFCGYLCPLGTLIDLFDGFVALRMRPFHKRKDKKTPTPLRLWVYVKYAILAGVMTSACFGVMIAEALSPITLLTRGMLFTGGRIQLAEMKGPNHLGAIDGAFYLSLALFAVVFLLSLFGKRFWCRCLCPTGALFSLLSFLRIIERKVDHRCIKCGECPPVCDFNAIDPDFATRTSECVSCQACGGACPVEAITFPMRLPLSSSKKSIPSQIVEDDNSLVQLEVVEPPKNIPLSRRGFVTAAIHGTVIGWGVGSTKRRYGLLETKKRKNSPIRPPGSVSEKQFLELCIRCGQCIKVCPGPVLHPAGHEYGPDSLWTPVARLEHAGCHQDCNFCTQVCPTGAIQPLEIEEKRTFTIGTAIIKKDVCLPFREEDRQECDLCAFECTQAGYDAIEMRYIDLSVDHAELEMYGFSEADILEMSRIKAPHVDVEKCVGCGICQYRCHERFVIQVNQIEETAIVVRSKSETLS